MTQQFNDFDSRWKAIDSLIVNGRPADALKQANAAYSLAAKNNKAPEQLRALLYRMAITESIAENATLENMALLQQEITTLKAPAKQVAHGLLAQTYWQFFSAQRWKIYNRTAVAERKNDDPETWTASDFQEFIAFHFKASLEDAGIAQQTKLSAFSPMIIEGNEPGLRPTLYDLLAHNALEFFKQNEIDNTKPADAFELEDAASFAPGRLFIRHTFSSTDSSNHVLEALRIYQQLTAFHLKSGQQNALIDIETERVQFAYENYKGEYKKRQYKEALDHIYTQYASNKYGMQAGYLLAVWWQEQALAYLPHSNDPEAANGYTIATEYCRDVIAKFPDSEGGKQAQNLLHELTEKQIGLTTELVNVPGLPFRAKADWKNTNQVWLRVVQIDKKLEQLIHNYDNERETKLWNALVQATPQKQWQQSFPAITDMRTHSAEIKIDALPIGQYAVIASVTEDFSLSENSLSYTLFHVSNISHAGMGQDHFILNRSTGKPLADAEVKVYESYYDYDDRKRSTKLRQTSVSDANGHISIDIDEKRQGGLSFDVSYGDDKLYIRSEVNAFPVYYSGNNGGRGYNLNTNSGQQKFKDENARFFFFLDRGLYRPGQQVFFKAIAITRNPETMASTVFMPQKPVAVLLYDANNRKIDSVTLTVNQFGSINGSFKLPAQVLTGNFRLAVTPYSAISANFTVEEYKRPKFYTTLAPPEEEYKVGDSIRVTGLAKAFAGNALDGAAVAYRVYRNARFDYPWLFRGYGRIMPPWMNDSRQEITSGNTTTDAQGNYNIAFTAMADLAIDKTFLPNYTYTIEATVTDINGETHEVSQSITAGYRSLSLTINGLQEYNDVQRNKPISVTATTLNGSAVQTPVQLKIYALQYPDSEIRERYWDAPDTVVMDSKTFKSFFPADPYRNEDDKQQWERGALVQTISLPDTNHAHSVNLPALAVGWYEIVAEAKDKDGLPVQAAQRFAMIDEANKKLPGFLAHYTPQTTITAQPGMQATIVQATSAPALFVIEQEARQEKDEMVPQPFRYHHLTGTMHSTKYAVGEADRGGFNVARMFVYNNRFYQTNYYISVPYTNKQLKISWQTFRDKLLPGAQETWTATIEGMAGEMVAAEALAGMYDASLDQIKPFNWAIPNVWSNRYFGHQFQSNNNFQSIAGNQKVPANTYKEYNKIYARLRGVYGNRYGSVMEADYNKVFSGEVSHRAAGVQLMQAEMASDGALQEVVVIGYGATMNKAAAPPPGQENKSEENPIDATNPGNIQVRKNFNETAFFFPDLKTDDKGRISFSFTMPEALTEWKIQLLAHTRELAFGKWQGSVVTQKELMVQPFTPRFMRQGDAMELMVKIVNLTDKETTGSATLELLDAATLKPVDGYFKNVFPNQYFTASAKGSIALRFPIEAPAQYDGGLVYRVIAKANNGNSDGEELIIPVLPDRLLVTESMPIYMNGAGTKQMDFAKLLQSNESPTLQHQSVTVEYSSNPVWYAVQSLPYLMEYPYDCAEQTWNRYYANRLAAYILNSNPAIATVVQQWRNNNAEALVSNLQKNEELKQLLLAETPWLLAGKTESEQKQQLAMLMQADRMQAESLKALNKLRELQSPNGGFVWFKGGPDDRYMTQYIVTAMAQLKQLNAWPANGNEMQLLQQLQSRALNYLNNLAVEDYKALIKREKDLNKHLLRAIDIQYLFAISHFPAQQNSTELQQAIDFYRKQALQYWLQHSKYQQGMIALYAHRTNATAKAKEIIASLKQYSITQDEFGRYWKEFNNPSYYWWQAPVESHALLTIAFHEIEQDRQTVYELKTWLLRQKQTQHWKTTKATADACYALLATGSNWINATPIVNISLGKAQVSQKAEPGTGYIKQRFDGEAVKSEMGKITVRTTNSISTSATEVPPGWGAVYWQYYEKLENITTAATGVQMEKQLYLKTNSQKGPVLTTISDGKTIKKGSTVTVRLVIKSDRTLEYVHLKDMRAATFEPKMQLSGYRYQGGLGYYEAPGDVATNFFIGYLPKGTYVFEYDMVATIDGNFTNGITTLQCMYAPEFSTHSQGIRVNVGE